MSETRCPQCGGDGWELIFDGKEYHWIPCTNCTIKEE